MNDEILMGIRAAAEDIRNDYENREYARAMRRVMELADVINEYVDREKPWELAKNPETADKLQYVASVALEGFRLLTLYLKPVLPATAERVEKFLNCGSMQWDSVNQTLSSERPISKFEHLMGRVDREKQLDVLLPDPDKAEAKVQKTCRKRLKQSLPSKPSPLRQPPSVHPKWKRWPTSAPSKILPRLICA